MAGALSRSEVSPRPEELAAAIVSAFRSRVPSTVSCVAEGATIALIGRGNVRVDLCELYDQPAEANHEEVLEIATSAAVANIQDFVMETIGEPWPVAQEDTASDIVVADGEISAYFRHSSDEPALMLRIWPPRAASAEDARGG